MLRSLALACLLVREARGQDGTTRYDCDNVLGHQSCQINNATGAFVSLAACQADCGSPPAPPAGCLCGAPPAAPSHASVSCQNLDGSAYPLGAAIACGDSCTFTCADGFADPVANGTTSKDFQCGDDALFTDHALECQAVPEPVPEPEPAPPAPPAGCVCGIPPPAPSHASASCMESRGVAYPLGAAIACGDSCTFTCADGFADPVANGATSKDFQCTTLTALFTDHALECQAVPEPEPEPAPSPGCVCGIPPAAPAHAAVTCLKSDGAAYPLGAAVACGDLCTVACNDHFADPVANGATRKDFQCAGAQFTDHTLDCQAVPEPEPEPCECGAAPPRPQHAQTTCWQAEIRCGESCTFTCDNHFTDPDKGTSTTFSCAVDGVFTDHSLNCQLEPEPEPLPEPEPEDKLCDEAYKAAFASTMSPQGVCQGPAACMPDHPNTPCQKLITNMLQRCKDVVYNETVDGRTVSRSFDQQAVLALKQLGPATCDYHEGYEACEATCTMAHATQALGDGCGKWFFSTLWQGFCRPDGSDSDFSACKDAGPEGGCSAACMTRFYDYQDKCAGCQDPLVQDFLSKAAGGALKTPSASCLYNHLPCMGAATCMTGCDNVTERVLRTCCSGESTECDGNCIGVPKKKCNAPDNGCRWLDDPKKSGAARCIAEDPFPSTCASDGGCQEAVVAAALEVCPKIFYEQPRMFGLYTDCTEGRPETVSDLEEAYMREVPDMPIVPPPPPAHPFVPHYNEDTGRWEVSDTFVVVLIVVGALLIISTGFLAMSKKKIKAQAHTARISTTGVATTSIYDIPVEPRPSETFFS